MKRYLLAAVSLFTACQPLALNSGVGGSSTSEATPLPSALSSASPTFLPTPQTTPSPQLSATPSPVVSPSALPSIAPVPVVSVSVPAVIIPDIPVPSGLSGFDMLGLGYFYEFGLEPGQQRRIALPTQPGETYTFSIEGYLRYFGDNPQTPLFSNALAGVIHQVFVATSPYTFFVLESQGQQNYRFLVRKGHYLSFPIPTPEPTLANDCCYTERANFRGGVFNDYQEPLENVTVRAHSLSSAFPYEETTTTANGKYVFNAVPAGIQVEITATRSGFTTRRRVEVLKSSTQGDPNANRYDFGVDPSGQGTGSVNNALSDKPEVVKVQPGRSASGVQPNTVFSLHFSEPVNPQSVENSFAIRAYNRRKLSVDLGNTRPDDANTVTGPNSADFKDLTAISGTPIWDKNAFQVSWNADKTEVSFQFKDQKALPSDRDSNLTADYQVAFQSFDGQIKGFKDLGGISSNPRPFKIFENFEAFYKFAINTDTLSPRLESLTWSGSHIAPVLSLNFNEAMYLPTAGRLIAGGMNGQSLQAALPLSLYGISPQAVAQNYSLSLRRQGQNLLENISWSELGGIVGVTADLRQVTLSLGSGPTSLPVLQTGDQLTLQVAAQVMDPAGNTIDPLFNQRSLIVP